MPTYHGKNGVVKIGLNPVAVVTEFNVEEGAKTSDNTAMGQTAETHLVGQTEWSGSLSCFYDDTDINAQEALVAGASVNLGLYFLGTASGRKYKTGTATVTRVTSNSSKEGVVTRNFNFQGNGALAPATAP